MHSRRVLLLSIKPEYASLILCGEKKIEFRRSPFRQSIDYLIIYSSSPEQVVVGTAEVKGIVSAAPRTLWKYAQELGGGITRAALLEYFAGKEIGYGFQLFNVVAFKKRITPTDISKEFRAPQSFMYLCGEELERWESVLPKRKKTA
jgi:predicted transcriptional regulator